MANTLKGIQKFSGSTTADQSIDNITLSTIVQNKTFHFACFNHTYQGDHTDTFKTSYITSTTNLNIRGETTGTGNNSVNYKVYVVEYDSGSDLIVEHKSSVIQQSGGTTQNLSNHSTITLAESMLINNNYQDSNSYTSIGKDEMGRMRLTSTTQSEISLGNWDSTETRIYKHQVVDWNDANVTAQRGVATMTGTSHIVSSDSGRATSGSSDYTQVDRTRTILFISYKLDSAHEYNEVPADYSITATMDSNNDIIITRTNSNHNIYFAWEIIEFPSSYIKVQHGEISQGDGTSNSTASVTAVGDTSTSIAIGTVATPFGHGGGKSASTTTGAIDRCMWTIELEDSTTVRAIRGDGTSAGVVGYQVLEFEPSDTLLNGDLTGSAVVSGDLTTEITLAASIISSESVTADLTTGVALNGDLTGSAVVSGDLTTEITFAGDFTAAATLTGDLTVSSIDLLGDLFISGSITGNLQAGIVFAGDLVVNANVTAILSQQSLFVGNLVCSSEVFGELFNEVILSGISVYKHNKKTQRVSRKFSDVDLDFIPNISSRDVVKKFDEEAIKRSVRNLIQLNLGEKPFHPEIGSNIRSLLFQPITPVTGQAIKTSIQSTINNFEPRVKLLNVTVVPNPDKNYFSASITFTIINNEQPITINVFLERLR